MTIDQHGQGAARHRLQRDHRATSHGCRGQCRRIAAEEHVSGDGGIGQGLGAQRGVVGILGDQHGLRPGPRSDGPSGGPPEGGCGLAQEGQHVPRLERHEPGSLFVIAHGEHDGEQGKAGVVALEGVVADVPRRAVFCAVKPRGGSPASASVKQNVTPEADTQIARTFGRDDRPSRDRPKKQLAASSDRRAGTSAKRCNNVAASWASSDGIGCSIRSPLNRVPSLRWRLARRANAAQAMEPRPSATSSGRCPGDGALPVAASPSLPTVISGASGIGGQPQAPPCLQLIRIDEVRPATEVAAEIERWRARSNRRRRRGDLKRSARACHPAARCRSSPTTSTGPFPVSRGSAAVAEEFAPVGSRRTGSRAGCQREWCAEARQGEHAERDSCRHAVENRRALPHADLAVAHVGHDGPDELRAAGDPCHPGRQDEQAQRRMWERSPAVPQASGQGIPDDHHEHDRHGGEREESSAGGADDVE